MSPQTSAVEPGSQRVLLELLHGTGAHIDPIGCFADLSAEVAGRKADAAPHTIWEWVSHLNYWMEFDLRRIIGEGPQYPEHASEGWPPHSAPQSEAERHEAVKRFRELLGEFEALANSTPEALSREVPPATQRHTQQASSVLAMLWQTITHNSYHVGQIALVRRVLGAWPPAAGEDTW